MRVCTRCQKWRLLEGQCTVCASVERLRAAASSSRLPTTLEAEAKVTKILDSCYYSIARLFPESDEDSDKGGVPPRRKAAGDSSKGEKSPKAKSGNKEAGEETPEGSKKLESPKEEKEERKVNIKEEKQKAVETGKSEGSKVLPKRKEEEEKKRARSRTPVRQREKDKRKKDKKDSRSGSVSGSRTRKKKREDHSPQKAEVKEARSEARPSSGIQREAYLRPRPSQRETRAPRTPDHPPPRTSLIPPATGRGIDRGQGWRGPVPYSSHPRWSEGTNKGVTKRAKQELYDRRQSRSCW